MNDIFERAYGAAYIIIPEEKLPENLEEFLMDGMRRIMTLCEEGILEIKKGGIQSNRACDIDRKSVV